MNQDNATIVARAEYWGWGFDLSSSHFDVMPLPEASIGIAANVVKPAQGMTKRLHQVHGVFPIIDGPVESQIEEEPHISNESDSCTAPPFYKHNFLNLHGAPPAELTSIRWKREKPSELKKDRLQAP